MDKSLVWIFYYIRDILYLFKKVFMKILKSIAIIITLLLVIKTSKPLLDLFIISEIDNIFITSIIAIVLPTTIISMAYWLVDFISEL
jgi:hypothetical protein